MVTVLANYAMRNEKKKDQDATQGIRAEKSNWLDVRGKVGEEG